MIQNPDYFGIASSNNVKDKFEKTGLTAYKSQRVNAPVIKEYPLTLECSVEDIKEEPYGLRILGKIENVLADEEVLDEEGKIDPKKLNAFIFDQMQNGYYLVGDKAGQAWKSGLEFTKK